MFSGSHLRYVFKFKLNFNQKFYCHSGRFTVLHIGTCTSNVEFKSWLSGKIFHNPHEAEFYLVIGNWLVVIGNCWLQQFHSAWYDVISVKYPREENVLITFSYFTQLGNFYTVIEMAMFALKDTSRQSQLQLPCFHKEDNNVVISWNKVLN